jgi:hypothetical protein
MERVKLEMHRDDLLYLLQFFKNGDPDASSDKWTYYMIKAQCTAFVMRLESLLLKYKQKKVITKVLTFTVTECWILEMFCRSPHPNAVNDVYFQTLLLTLAAELDKQIKQVAV